MGCLVFDGEGWEGVGFWMDVNDEGWFMSLHSDGAYIQGGKVYSGICMGGRWWFFRMVSDIRIRCGNEEMNIEVMTHLATPILVQDFCPVRLLCSL